jgi:hypothetical protein
VLLPSAEVLPFSYYFDRSAFEQYRTLATSMRNRRVFPIDDLNQLTSAAVAGTSRVLVVRRLDAKYDIDAVANATRPGGDVVARQRVRGIELAVYDHPERE